eukprot:m.220867 g.220867  ORF g.220867 m.220867 type:complete len:363 (+) comp39951_c0_seq1:199-1287(+)
MAFLSCLVALLTFTNALANQHHQTQIPILRDLGKKHGLFIGSAAGVAHFNGDIEYKKILGEEFSLVTPENSCKWTATEPANGQFDFKGCDFILNTTIQFNQVFRGHNLCWGSHNPDWLNKLSQNKTALEIALSQHIRTVVQRYKGKAYGWDVVNEAVLDNPSQNHTFKNNIWHPTIPDYIDMAFKIAHEADPMTKLFYNDYNAEGLNGKSDAIYNMLKSMLQRGIPVHGIGLQAHFTLGTDFTQTKTPKLGRLAPSYDDLATNIKRLADLGLEVHITEMDVSFQGGKGTTQELLKQQADVYARVLKACLSNQKCKNFEVWGYVDKYSWRKANEEPDLFDSNYQPKPCFDAVAALLNTTNTFS